MNLEKVLLIQLPNKKQMRVRELKILPVLTINKLMMHQKRSTIIIKLWSGDQEMDLLKLEIPEDLLTLKTRIPTVTSMEEELLLNLLLI